MAADPSRGEVAGADDEHLAWVGSRAPLQTEPTRRPRGLARQQSLTGCQRIKRCARTPIEEAIREEDLPTQHPTSGPAPRVSAPHVDQGRPSHSSCPSPARPCPAIGLIWRIRDRATFTALARQGRRASSGPLTLVYLAEIAGTVDKSGNSTLDSGADPPRVAFAVPRAVGSAVVRNRVRRRLRAVLHGRITDGTISGGALLISVRPPAGDLSSDQLRADLDKALGVLAPPGGQRG